MQEMMKGQAPQAAPAEAQGGGFAQAIVDTHSNLQKIAKFMASQGQEQAAQQVAQAMQMFEAATDGMGQGQAPQQPVGNVPAEAGIKPVQMHQ